MSSLLSKTYAQLQATDAVTGKFMFTDCADKDAFYRLRTSRAFNFFEGSTVYDSNPIFFDNDIRGNATITGPSTTASMTLTVTGSTVNDYAARQSHYYANYQPGKSFHAMFSFSMGSPVNGIVKRVGLYDVDNATANQPLNGVLFEQTDTGGYRWVIHKGDGTTQSALQASWNVDPLNGSGPSGETLNLTENLLGFVDLEWLGVGRVRVGFYIRGVPVICHAFNNTGFTVPYLNNPYLPIRYEVRRISGSLSGSMTAICCMISSEGGFDPLGIIHAIQSPKVSINNANKLSLISIRLKSGYSRSFIIPVTVEIASNIGGNANAFFSVYLWRPSSTAAVPAGWADVASITGGGGTGSYAEYNNSTSMYSSMVTDVTTNNAICIQIDQGSVSSVTKNTLQTLSHSLSIAQSAVNKSNTDILVVVVDNTTPNARYFTALFTWREN